MTSSPFHLPLQIIINWGYMANTILLTKFLCQFEEIYSYSFTLKIAFRREVCQVSNQKHMHKRVSYQIYKSLFHVYRKVNDIFTGPRIMTAVAILTMAKII